MGFDPVLGGVTPDKSNAGRLKWNTMTNELDSRFQAVEAGPLHQIFELQQDAISNTTSFMDTGLEFPVESGVLYNFFAMLLCSPEIGPYEPPYDPGSWDRASGDNQGAKFSVSGPGSTPSPVTWLHYVVQGGQDFDPEDPHFRAHSQYDTGTPIPASQIGDTGSLGDRVVMINGFVQPPSLGTFKIRFGSENNQANGYVIRAGSTVEVW